jgi:hypothetical protein
MSDKRFPANIISSTAVEPTGSFEDSSASGTWSLQEAFTYVKAGLWPTAGNARIFVEDVFSTYLYTGNGSTQTITNGIDLAGEGGLVWTKRRSGPYSHSVFDTNRGTSPGKLLSTNSDIAEQTDTNVLTSYNSDGYSLGSNVYNNASGQTYASWTFRKAPRFFDVVTYTGNGVDNRTIPHNLGADIGTCIIKRTDSTGNWMVWHRSLPDGENLRLQSTDAQGGYDAFYEAAMTDTTFGVRTYTANTNISGATYVAYLFAHDPLGPSGDGSDGLIACGSYTGNGSTQTITLGWEPQWILTRATSADNWVMLDSMRGISTGGIDARLYANSSSAEDNSTDWVSLNPTGYTLPSGTLNASSTTFIYIAIRRGPMREPTSGTEVFAVDAGDGSSVPAWTSGFPVDMALERSIASDDMRNAARLISGRYLVTNTTAAEVTNSARVFDYMNGWLNIARSTSNYSWMFRRAPGFFDVVAYTGTGSVGQVIPHNLGVAPELVITKLRNSTFDWGAYADYANNGNFTGRLYLNTTVALQDPSTTFFTKSASNLTVQTVSSMHNASGSPYIAYLFASLPGISKVGSYTGNGSSQTINCGFTSGARFVLIKRTDSTGDWYVWDSARGIVAGNDPHLSLNTTAAEVTTDDSVDAESSGFIVNQVAATNVNVNAASYIFLAIA